MSDRTALHIMPFNKDGKILLLFADEVNYPKALKGDEDARFTCLCLNVEDFSTIENIVVEFSDGKPVLVRTVA